MKAIVLALMLAGCASDLVKVSEPQAVTITWVRVDPVTCGAVKALGCAVTSPTYDARDCLIIMPEDSPDWVVAEEFRHCFGYMHRGALHQLTSMES